jgi:hypothetical protein
MGSDEIQAIANTAAFHFPSVQQGGSSLYSALGQLVTDVTVLKIMFGIGGAEVNHFAIWHDKAGNTPAVSAPGRHSQIWKISMAIPIVRTTSSCRSRVTSSVKSCPIVLSSVLHRSRRRAQWQR